MSYTQGPWKYRRNANGSLDFFGEDGGRVILSNARLMNQEANAQLIAAAPNMLDALTRLLAQCDRLRLTGQAITSAEKFAAEVIREANGGKE